MTTAITPPHPQHLIAATSGGRDTRGLDARENARRVAAWTYYPMPSTFLFAPALTAVLPAAAVVWFPGLLGSSTAYILLVFGVALYCTRRAFALWGQEDTATNWWDAASWRLPTGTDLAVAVLAMMVVLSSLSAGFAASAALFTVATWAWLVGRGYCAARRNKRSGMHLVRDVFAQWKRRSAEYQRRR